MAQKVLDTLQARGLLQQITLADELTAWLDGGARHFYVGYDPTGASLHVGHLVTLMALRHLAHAGHKPIVLIGGATARIGDPSGKTEARPLLDEASIEQNGQKIAKQIANIIGSDAHNFAAPTLVDNHSWLGDLNWLDVLRRIGRHFSVNRMLAAESYKARLATGLSFLEFNYQLLQALDFSELCTRYDCRLQLGGDDQWGNILAGVELSRRLGQGQCFGATVPLLTTASGRKMGKTAEGAIWLDAALLPPAAFYQFWVNVDDADVARFLRIFTVLPLAEIEALQAQMGAGQGATINAGKSILAYEVTQLVHGTDHARAAHQAAQGAFGGRALPCALLPSSQVPRAVVVQQADIVGHALSPEQLGEGVALLPLLVALGWAKSNNEARRLVTQNSVRCGEDVCADVHKVFVAEDFAAGDVLLRAGKKKVVRLYVQAP